MDRWLRRLFGNPRRVEARPGDAFHGEFGYRLRDNWRVWLWIFGPIVAVIVITSFT